MGIATVIPAESRADRVMRQVRAGRYPVSPRKLDLTLDRVIDAANQLDVDPIALRAQDDAYGDLMGGDRWDFQS